MAAWVDGHTTFRPNWQRQHLPAQASTLVCTECSPLAKEACGEQAGERRFGQRSGVDGRSLAVLALTLKKWQLRLFKRDMIKPTIAADALDSCEQRGSLSLQMRACLTRLRPHAPSDATGLERRRRHRLRRAVHVHAPGVEADFEAQAVDQSALADAVPI
eukprot:6173066-Pleurochrysis_carterae.AAC.1